MKRRTQVTDEISLPKEVEKLWKARNALEKRYDDPQLRFTLDGRLVGDIGEALAKDAFGVRLCEKRTAGVDAHTRRGKSVQIKATGSKTSGPSFSRGEGKADYLLFFWIDFGSGKAKVLYNGPEAPIRGMLPKKWDGTKTIALKKVIAANGSVSRKQRLRQA